MYIIHNNGSSSFLSEDPPDLFQIGINLETGEVTHGDGVEKKKENGKYSCPFWCESQNGSISRVLQHFRNIWLLWQRTTRDGIPEIVSSSEVIRSTGWTGMQAQFVHWAWNNIGVSPFDTEYFDDVKAKLEK